MIKQFFNLLLLYVIVARCWQQPELDNTPNELVTFNEGDSVSLNCNATGDSYPAIHWVRLDAPMSEGANYSGGSLLIPSFSASHHGLYACVAINNVGMVTSNITSVFLNGSSVTFDLDNVEIDDLQLINEEDTAMATCCVGDVKPIMNTWMRLTSTFSNTTSSATKTNLFISDFDSSDDDVYFCLSGNINAVSLYATKLKVKNDCSYSSSTDNTSSDTTNLHGSIEETFPESLITVANDSYIKFYCCFEEDYHIEYLRFNILVDKMNGEYAYDHFDSEHDTDRYIHINDASDFTYYYCTLSDAASNTYKISNVTTIEANNTGYTEWVDNYHGKVAEVDQNVTLYINTTGEINCCWYGDYHVIWLKDGLILEEPSLYTSINSSILTIENVQSSDRGIYSCLINEGNNVNHIYVEVDSVFTCPLTSEISNITIPFEYAPPNMTGTPTPGTMSTTVGGSLSLSCNATGTPEPSIHWMKLNVGTTVESSNGTLTIANYSVENNGVYVCVAVNKVGMDVSGIVILTDGSEVFDSDSLKVDDVKVIDNGEVIVQVCCTSITKPLDFNWLKLDNTPISTNSSTSETLVIPEFNSLTDEDVYFCLSGNGINVSMYALKIRVRNTCPYSKAFNSTQSDIIHLENQAKLFNSIFVDPESSIPLPVGDTLQLECYVFARDVNVHWIRTDGQNISDLAIGTHYIFLIILSVEASDLGHYACVQTTEKGLALSNSVDISGGANNFNLSSILSNVPDVNFEYVNGSIKILHCCIDEKVNNVQWFHNGSSNVSSVEGKTILTYDSKTLVIMDIDENDHGLYICVGTTPDEIVLLYKVYLCTELAFSSYQSEINAVALYSTLVPSTTIIISSSGNANDATSDANGVTSDLNSATSTIAMPSETPTVYNPDIQINLEDEDNSGQDDVSPELADRLLVASASSIAGLIAISLLAFVVIVLVCCQRGLFKGSYMNRVAKAKPVRLWDLVLGRNNDKALLEDIIDIEDDVREPKMSRYRQIQHLSRRLILEDSKGGIGTRAFDNVADYTTRRPHQPRRVSNARRPSYGFVMNKPLPAINQYKSIKDNPLPEATRQQKDIKKPKLRRFSVFTHTKDRTTEHEDKLDELAEVESEEFQDVYDSSISSEYSSSTASVITLPHVTIAAIPEQEIATALEGPGDIQTTEPQLSDSSLSFLSAENIQ